MAKQLLDSEIRLNAAISGAAKPDRTPVSPLFYYFAARQAGISFAELALDPAKYREAMDYCWEHFQPWDVYPPLNAINRDMMALAMPMKCAYPGVELPDDEQVQFLEEELLGPEDYDRLLEPVWPPDPKKVLKALRAETRSWLVEGLKAFAADELGARFKRTAEKLPGLLKSGYGEPRDWALELKGHIDFAKTAARLTADPELDTDLTLRYLNLILKVAAKARNRAGALENLLESLLASYRQVDFTRYDIGVWRERGVATLYGIGLEGPFDTFSMARSMMPFSSDDLFKRPEKIRECSELAADFFVAIAESGVALTGVRRFVMACHRTSNDFISPKHFRDLAFPAMRTITERLAERDISTVFHCDGKWDRNLEYLAQLPEGRCVFEFDGRTDMRLARKTLGDGHCIFGDVPAAMLVMAERSEVEAYCRDLIRDVGANGRFILGAGCEIPPDAKPENVRAMLEAPFLN